MSLIVDGNEDEHFVSFGVPLASGTKQGVLIVTIEGGEVCIMSKVDSSASWSITSLLNFLKKKEEAGDTCRLNRPNGFKILKSFCLPVAVDPHVVSTAIDDAGVLTLTFKRIKPMAFDFGNVPMWWEHAKDSRKGVVEFKAYFPAGTKVEDLTIGIELGYYHDYYLTIGMLQKKEQEGDTSLKQYDGNNFRRFLFPEGVEPFGRSTSMDDDGVLTLTFKKPNPILFPTVLERAFDLENVTMKWEHAKESKNGVVDFKAHLPAGTKTEDLMLGIGRGKYLIIGMLQKEEQDGDTSLRQYDGNKCKSFPLPEGVESFGYSTSMDDAGVLTLTFTKLKPKKKLWSKSKLLVGLARVVPACLMIGCEISDKISSDNDFV